MIDQSFDSLVSSEEPNASLGCKMESIDHLIISDVDGDSLRELEKTLKNSNQSGGLFWESILIGSLNADGTMVIGGSNGEVWHHIDVLPDMDGVSPADRRTEIGLYLTRLLARGINISTQVRNIYIQTQYDLSRFMFHIAKANGVPKTEYFLYPTTEEARKNTEHLLSEFHSIHVNNNNA
jgi:hypothetical protein